jgi:muramoyltetrapeptide carboxypeptidase
MPTAYCWCPAYPLADEAALARCRAQLGDLAGRLGWTAVESPSLAARLPQGRWAAAEERAADLAEALRHPVLVAARGGYGCIELSGALLAHRGRPGLLIGYSDLTVFHAIWRLRGWGETLYGFLPGVAGGPRSLASTAALARGDGLRCDHASDPGVATLRPGRARGTAFAACLRVLASLVGTPAMPDLAGTVLCLEDTDERPYQMDRDLQQLHRAGALSGVVGLVFGVFPARVAPGYAGPASHDIAAAWGDRLGVPAIAGLPFGHDADPLTLPCGRAAELEVAMGGWSLTIPARA